jgi:hypothetical protein
LIPKDVKSREAFLALYQKMAKFIIFKPEVLKEEGEEPLKRKKEKSH